ncbi:hypothetical protein BDW02DRAFT_351854 [Decorospora gaudefroyi]|uniref:Small nuclear ribonucleoprotein Prp3 C-terminal domain-containing protein n=1 Tax=Decorospora gaudefroyi TaxID=184978 RepID=A0A6A5KFR4_9PLEO|nr:hypothetical protein BDW02DRAFT_351854 [Decorospora gaudefroyi]
MTNAQWRPLPPDLVELQLGQIDLLLAMYPDEIVLEASSQQLLDTLRNGNDLAGAIKSTPNVPVIFDLPIDVAAAEPPIQKILRLDLSVPFVFESEEEPQDPPNIRVRIQQPSWMNNLATSRLSSAIPKGEDLLGIIEHIKEAAAQYLIDSKKKLEENEDAIAETGPLVRVWFYFPSISTRSKRDDFINYAPSYRLTGFLYAGKPGLLCVEGNSQSIDDYMKFIKTESWGDIPAHHKKVSERHREKCEQRVFPNMTEITDTVGERRGQRANRGDMKAIEEWLIERGMGDAFTKVLM